MPRKLTGHHWSCVGCGQGEDGYKTARERVRAVIKHTQRCRKCPSGQTVTDKGQVVWTKP